MATAALKAEVDSAVATLSGQKGWFTRDFRALDRQLDELLGSGRPASEEALANARGRWSQLQGRVTAINATIEKLCELDPSEALAHLARGDDVATKFSDVEIKFNRVMDIAEERKQAQVQAAAAAAAAVPAAAAPVGGGGGAPAQQRRGIREAIGLKPERLSHDAGHVRLRSWLLDFRAYYNGSRMDDGTDEERHAYFFACLDSKLVGRLRPEVAADAVVFQPADRAHNTSLEAHLRREFDATTSLFARRHHLFEMRQSRGQRLSDFHVKLRAQGDECDLDNLGTNQLYALRLITECNDPILKDELLKTDGELASVTKAIAAYETRSRTMVATTSSSLNYVASGWSRSGGNGCSFCGGANCRGKPSCPATNSDCLRCGKAGHFQSVCRQAAPKPAKAAQQQSSASSTPGSKGKKKKGKTEYRKQKDRGQHNAIESTGAAEGPDVSFGHMYSVEEVGALEWSLGGLPYVTGGRPTPQLRISINEEPPIFAVPDTGASWTVVPRSLVQKLRLRVDRSSVNTLRCANGVHMTVDGLVTLHLATRESVKSTSADVEALVCEHVNKVYVGWEALIALSVIPASFPSPSVVSTSALGASLMGIDGTQGEGRVRKNKTSVGPETSKCRQEAPSRQRAKGKPSQAASRGKAAPPAANGPESALLAKYSDVFDDSVVKPMVGPPMTIKLKSDARPKRILTARPIPAHLQQGASETLKMAVRSGVIVPVDQPTEWISPAFYVPKATPGKARLVTDYTQLNRYVDRPVHPFPSPLDVIKSIDSKSTVFAKLDASSGYFQIKLDEESSLLTTFLLPEGKFRYTRAPMGLSSSSDEFCRRTDEALMGLEGVVKVVDDILVQAKDRETLFLRVDAVLQRCRTHGITISKEKFIVGSEVTFAGFVVSSTGVRPDPAKVRAITKFPTPTDVTSVRSFLGLVNQLGIFVSNLAAVTDPLRTLLKKNVTWMWTPDHQAAFEAAKRRLAEPLNVAPFDLGKPTTLWTDASTLHGMGYALEQEGRLIQAGSRSLLDAETRYAVVELEATAVAWSIKACRHYLLGCPSFVVKTDHRPLVGLFNKDLIAIDNPRLQRIRESVLGYVFNVEHVPGKSNAAADALSRYPLEAAASVAAIEDEELEDPGLADLVAATTRDVELQELKRYIRGDMPHADLTGSLSKYRPWFPQISVHKTGLLLVDCKRILVPKASRPTILKAIHQAHPGLQRSLSLGRRHYVWPGMRNDIAQVVAQCDQCQTVRQAKPVEKPFLDRTVSAPMEAISCDLCESKGRHFLVVVDRFSGFPLVARLTTKTTGAVVGILEKWFNELGWPKRLGSDGGPQFRQDFEEWCSANSIAFELSSARNPASNGLAEAGVKRVKHLLEKIDGPSSFTRGLLALRNTPMSNGRPSPAQAFFTRDLRVPGLPTVPTAGPPTTGRRVRVSEFQPGDKVRVNNPDTKRWTDKATVMKIRRHGASVWLRMANGRVLVRNQRFLKPLDAAANQRGVKKERRGTSSKT